MAVKVGSVTVDLVANTQAFTAGLRTAGESLKAFGKNLARVQGFLGAGFGVALVPLTANLTRAAAQFQDAAMQLGVSAEFLQEWQRVVASAGVPAEKFNDILKDLNERLGDALVLQGGEAREAIQALGLSLEELVAIGPERAFEKVFKALSDVNDITARTTLADKLFADAGQELTGVMNRTTESIMAQRAQLRELGVILSNDGVANAKAFSLEMTQAGQVLEGFGTQAVAGLTPALRTLAGEFLNMGSAANFGAQTGEFLGRVLINLTRVAAGVSGVFQTIGESIGAVAVAARQTVEGEFAGAGRTIEELFLRTQRRGEELLELFDRLGEAPPRPELSDVEPSRPTTGDVAEGRALRDRLAGTTAARTASLTRLTEAQRAHQALLREGALLMEQARSPAETLAATHARLSELLKVNAIDQRAFNVLLEQARERWREETDALQERANRFEGLMREQSDIAERALADLERRQENFRTAWMHTFLSPLQAFVDGTRTAKEAFAGLIADVTGMLTRLAAEQTFRQLFGMNQGVGGGAFTGMLGTLGDLFGGLLPRFQHGGSMRVGGTGGADSQVVALRATPGERITVTPSMGGGAGDGITVVQHITVQGTGRESVEQLGTAAGLAVRSALARNG